MIERPGSELAFQCAGQGLNMNECTTGRGNGKAFISVSHRTNNEIIAIGALCTVRWLDIVVTKIKQFTGAIFRQQNDSACQACQLVACSKLKRHWQWLTHRYATKSFFHAFFFPVSMCSYWAESFQCTSSLWLKGFSFELGQRTRPCLTMAAC